MERGQAATDSELVGRARGGDQRAFHELVDRHGRSMYGLAVRLVGQAQDAEDVTQEAFAAAFEGLRSFRGQSSFKTWLTQILVRKAAGYFRKAGKRKVLSLDAVEAPAAQARGTGATDVRLDLEAALLKLAPEHREVIVLRELQGLAYDEIAAVLGVPKGTVESRLFRARRELCRLMEL